MNQSRQTGLSSIGGLSVMGLAVAILQIYAGSQATKRLPKYMLYAGGTLGVLTAMSVMTAGSQSPRPGRIV